MNEQTLAKILLALFILGIVSLAVIATLFGIFIWNKQYYPIEDDPGIPYWDKSNPTTFTPLPLFTATSVFINQSSGDPYPPPDATQIPNPYPPPEQPVPTPTLDECPGGTIIFNAEGNAACFYSATL